MDTQHLSENDMILYDDGETHNFQYATRSHVPRLFTSIHEVNLLMRQLKLVRKIPIREIRYDNPITQLYGHINNCTTPSLLPAVLAELVVIYEWTRSFSDMCQYKKLKIDIVPMNILELALETIKSEAQNYNFILSLGTLSSYYNLPITECIISKDVALIGIHVPLLRQALHGLALTQLITAPFAWNQYACSANVPNINVACVQREGNNWTILTPSCDLFRDELCILNQQFDNDARAILCVQTLLQETTAAMVAQACPFTCSDTETTTEFITRLDANRYLLTHPSHNSMVICNQTIYPLKPIPSIGALILTLPCNCQIQGQHTTVISNEVPCLNQDIKVTFTHTIPAAWAKFQSASLTGNSDIQLKFNTLEDCLNDKWLTINTSTHQLSLAVYLVIVCFTLTVILLLLILFMGYKMLQISKKLTHIHIDKSKTTTFHRQHDRANSPVQIPFIRTPIPNTSEATQFDDYLTPTASPTHTCDTLTYQDMPMQRPQPPRKPQARQSTTYVTMSALLQKQ